jgi:hypothetical protein
MVVCLADLMPAARTAVNGPTNGGRLEVKTVRIRQDNVVAVSQGNIGLNGDSKVEGNLRVDVTGSYVQFVESLLRDAAERNRAAEALQAGPQTSTFGGLVV